MADKAHKPDRKKSWWIIDALRKVSPGERKNRMREMENKDTAKK